MNRRQVLGSLAGGLAIASAAKAAALTLPAAAKRIPVPKSGQITVAFAISDQANLMDIAGPWETFQDMMLPNGDMPFHVYTVAETTAVVETVSGMRIEPTYAFDSLPDVPNIIVVGAQSNRSPAFMQLLRDAQGKVDLTMSVCTGAFKLAASGILDGKSATTHHEYYDAFAKQFPKVTLVRGERFVDNGTIVTAGGLTSGISAALHVISRYYDAASVTRTAAYMEFVPTSRPS